MEGFKGKREGQGRRKGSGRIRKREVGQGKTKGERETLINRDDKREITRESEKVMQKEKEEEGY